MQRREKRLINRELSWLSFNARVLQEAADLSVPLFERLRFLGIFSNNQDEFFRVRVATNRRMLLVKKGDFDTESNKNEIKKTLQAVQREVVSLQKRYDKIFFDLIEEFKRQNIIWIDEKRLNSLQEHEVKRYFKDEILSHLFPVLLDENKEPPPLKDSAIYLGVKMTKHNTAQVQYAIVEIPTRSKERFYWLHSQDSKHYILFLDDVIRANLRTIFSIFDYDTYEAYTIKITRDAELDIEMAVSASLYDKIKRALKLRNQGELVRFIYDKEMPRDMLKFFLNKLGLTKESTIPGQRYHNFKDLMKFPIPSGMETMLYQPFEQIPVRDFETAGNLFDKISKKDYLLTHPYQSFDYVIRFLKESALDPNVSEIKIALYRVAEYSNVVNALINAANNGKRVFVMMELKARFDEESNIYWSKKLIEAGATVFYGYDKLKVHSKICIVYRQEEGRSSKHYVHIGTGNYNAVTSKYYVDHSLFTQDTRITSEVDSVFNAIERFEEYKPEFQHLLVSPYNTRSSIMAKIDREIQHIQAGKTAWIRFKLNNLTDPILIEKLYEASQKGVKIDMIVRGICSLVPQVKGLSDNIQVISIVDRFLEHSRLYIFCNNNSPEYYFGSADLMQRNLDNRIEVVTPIFDEDIKIELNTFFEIQWQDNVKARIIDAYNHNEYRIPFEPKVRSQEKIYKLMSSGTT